MPLTPFIRKLQAYRNLSSIDTEFLETFCNIQQTAPTRPPLAVEGDRERNAYVLLDGWGCCYKMLPDGGRQIINLLLPGDFMGMRSLMFNAADHSFGTLSEARMAVLDRNSLRQAFEDHPHLGMTFLWSMARDEAIIVEHLVNLGRRSALVSLSHLLLETLYRLKLVRPGHTNEFAFPLTQTDLGDALGLSIVHVNRLLRQLREREIVTFRDGWLVIHSPEKLAKLAGFDAGYLDQPPMKL